MLLMPVKVVQFLMKFVTKRNYLLFIENGSNLTKTKDLPPFIVTYLKYFIVYRKHSKFDNEKLPSLCIRRRVPRIRCNIKVWNSTFFQKFILAIDTIGKKWVKQNLDQYTKLSSVVSVFSYEYSETLGKAAEKH